MCVLFKRKDEDKVCSIVRTKLIKLITPAPFPGPQSEPKKKLNSLVNEIRLWVAKHHHSTLPLKGLYSAMAQNIYHDLMCLIIVLKAHLFFFCWAVGQIFA